MSTRAGYAGGWRAPGAAREPAASAPRLAAEQRANGSPIAPAHRPSEEYRTRAHEQAAAPGRPASPAAPAGAPCRAGQEAPPQPGHHRQRGRRPRGGRRRAADHRGVLGRRHRGRGRPHADRAHQRDERRRALDERRRHRHLHVRARRLGEPQPHRRGHAAHARVDPGPGHQHAAHEHRPGRPHPDPRPGEGPCAAASFTYLAQQSFFDGSTCHRLVVQPSFGVLQCGDPTGTGSGGPSYKYAEEVTPETTYPRGTIAMAKTAAPGTTGSQFFLTFTDTTLPPEYTVVGTVDEAGLAVLDQVAAGGIEDVGPEGDGAPAIPVTIDSLSVQS
ncbi:peptidylprolyl isomerase [Blastococcus brunescens]|uniref:Peptidylprolyl isomerase n=1 Tax=Blastococcus brunescens TaxID=1564165 RepID=A0ABZ1B5V5_9ACTN|nr:peptidylprolyl isomerase [Blastococcus sp. BMG 8361]WRL66189.1 peptidylprolyl isomerase [Blastococcus sp. BMG 8361]